MGKTGGTRANHYRTKIRYKEHKGPCAGAELEKEAAAETKHHVMS